MPLDCWDLSRQWPRIGAARTKGVNFVVFRDCMQDRCGVLAESASSGRHPINESDLAAVVHGFNLDKAFVIRRAFRRLNNLTVARNGLYRIVRHISTTARRKLPASSCSDAPAKRRLAKYCLDPRIRPDAREP